MRKMIIIAGPTAVGKSEASVLLAKRINASGVPRNGYRDCEDLEA